MATVKISNLNPYIGIKIKAADYLPIITLNNLGSFSTFRTSANQIAVYVAGTITDQSLFTTDSVTFSSISGVASVSATDISAVNLYGDGKNIKNVFNQTLNTTDSVTFSSVSTTSIFTDSLSTAHLTSLSVNISSISGSTIDIANTATLHGLSVVSRYSALINHVGSTTPTAHTIIHSLPTEDVLIQVYERTLLLDGSVQNEQVVAHTYNVTKGNSNVSTLVISNTASAVYKVIISG